MMEASALLTRIEAAAYLRRSPRGFDRLRLPRVVIDRRPLFLKADLDRFIQSKRVTPVMAELAAVRSLRRSKLARTKGTGVDFEIWLRQQKAELVE
jgi:hypothetical protein